MKLRNDADIKAFLDIVKQCEGRVFLISPEGDQYNLKSTLTTIYLAMGQLLQEQGDKLELFAENKEDEQKLLKFLDENPQILG
ncbi:MAG: polya polymerase [Eubacteriales bacterium]|nr:polya polymerase [Eubacteriales bacterium]